MGTPGNGQPPWQGEQVDPLTGRPLGYQDNERIHAVAGYQQADYARVGGTQARRRRAGAVAGVVVLVLVLAGGVTTALLLGGPSTAGTAVAGPPLTSTTTSSATNSAPTTSETVTPTESTTKAATPGFHGVLSQRDAAAYDVPKGWKIDSPGLLVGYEFPDKNGKIQPRVVMHAPASFKGRCHGDTAHRAQTGMLLVGNANPVRAAREGAVLWLRAAAADEKGKSPHVALPRAKPLELAGGKITARTATATVRPLGSGSCSSPLRQVTTVSYRQHGKTRLLIIEADRKVPDAVSPKTITKIAASLRPATG